MVPAARSMARTKDTADRLMLQVRGPPPPPPPPSPPLPPTNSQFRLASLARLLQYQKWLCGTVVSLSSTSCLISLIAMHLAGAGW